VVSALAVGCAAKDAPPFIEPPDMMEQLANSNLKAPGPINAGGNGSQYRGAGHTVADLDHGDDTIAGPTPPKPAGISQQRGGYELNFNEAELSELAKVILQDTLSIPYVYDPRVQGRVTVSTGGPVSRTEILSVLETVLAMNRAALIVEGNLYRIVPDIEGRPEIATSFNYARERQEIGPGYGVSIIPLKFVSTDTMRRMLASLGTRPGGVRAGVMNNLLVIRGTGRERQSLLEVAMMFDVDWMRGQSAGLFTLANATPEEIIKSLHEVFQTEAQGKGLIRFQPISRLNAILVLTQKADLLDKAEEWVMRLDRTSTEGDDFYVYRVENGKAKDLAQVLNASFGGGGSGTSRKAEETEVGPNQAASHTESKPSTTESMSSSAGDQAVTAESTSTPSGGLTVTASASGGGESLESGSGEVRITPNESNNTLLIKAPAREYRKILGILRRIDRPALQVLINATLAEVALNDNLKYGVQFYLQKNGGKSGLLGFSNGSQLEISPVVPGMNFIVGAITDPKVVIDALATETAVRVVSSPSVVVLHNQTATLQVGDEVPIATRQASSVINPDAPLVNEIQFKNTGVILKVTPRISTNGLVSMEIEQEISAVSKTIATGADASLTPTISTRSISSNIAVQSGQMVVLGGLISERLDDQKNRIPVLGKIPYLGDILGAQTDSTKARTELVVFLRPTVIRNPEEAGQVAEAVRAGMQSMAPRPAAWDAQTMPQGTGVMK
jgi:general secretion pathway protein D